MTVIPDSIEPVEAWRTWVWNGAALASHNGAKWTPGEPLTATCEVGTGYELVVVPYGMSLEEAREAAHHHNQGRGLGFFRTFPPPPYLPEPNVELPPGYGYALKPLVHDAPWPNCTCGIYAADELAQCPPGSVAGKVKMWGTVVPGETGLRAQHAYPSEFHVPPSRAEDPTLLAFGVPIIADQPEQPEIGPYASGSYMQLLTSFAGPGMTMIPRPPRPRAHKILWLAMALNVVGAAYAFTHGFGL